MSLGFDIDGNPLHTRAAVWGAMMLQICMSYPGLPDVRTMSLDEVEWFYEGIRRQLKKDTKPR